jgi:DNA-binding transcriptional ArsR family regulator
MAVGQLAQQLPVSRPAVSQHLRVLKEAGLVTDHADGTRRIYRVSHDGVQAIHVYLDQMWSQALAGLRRAAQHIAVSEQAVSEQSAGEQEEQP